MTKKVLLFLVEGLSDKDALEPILSELVDNTKIHFEVLRYDLSADNSTQMQSSNMKQRITKVVKSFLENNHGIKKSNIEKVIFLTDTDGCYIDENSVYYSSTDQNFRYEDDGIYTDRPQNVIHRNRMKVRNLDTINSTAEVFNLPIEVYYFSCNLDHVLHEERNLSFNYRDSWMQIKNNNNSLLRYTNLMVFFLNNVDLLKNDVKEKVSICCS